MSTVTSPPGWRLWIDAVGVYRLHAADVLMVGGPSESAPADLSLLAPLSRLHARIEAHGERLRFVPLGSSRVNERPVSEPVWLERTAEVSLGDEGLEPVRLRITQPSHLSASARIDFLSEHRPRLALDGLIFLRGTCLLGPAAGHHVRWPDCDPPLVLFLQGDRLAFRNGGEWLVDGEKRTGVVTLEPETTLSRGDLRLRAEPVSATGAMTLRTEAEQAGSRRWPEVVQS